MVSPAKACSWAYGHELGLDVLSDEGPEGLVSYQEVDDKAYQGGQELAAAIAEGFPDTAHYLNNFRAVPERSGSFLSFFWIPGLEPDQLAVPFYPGGFVPIGQDVDGVLAGVSRGRRKLVQDLFLFFFRRVLVAFADFIGQRPFVFHV